MLAAKIPMLPKGADKTAVTPRESDKDIITRRESADHADGEAPSR